MLVSHSASAAISVANSQAKEPLAEPRPHWHRISIAGRSFSNQICDRFDIPISIAHESTGETFIKDAPPFASVEIVRLALLDPSLCPASGAFPLFEDLTRHNSGAPERDPSRVPSAVLREADDLEAIVFLLW